MNVSQSEYLAYDVYFFFFFWTSAQLPSGVLCKPPELPCCQEVWVPAETPLHLPGALQVDRTDILFSHWQITGDRERKMSGHVSPHYIMKPFHTSVALFELHLAFSLILPQCLMEFLLQFGYWLFLSFTVCLISAPLHFPELSGYISIPTSMR